MVGQLDLVAQISSYTPTTFPHSILLLGERGCGKHTLIEEICKMYELEFVDITDSICLDTITQASVNLVPTLYLIDLDKITERQQNIILKFLEEPSDNAYIALISTVRSLILDTVYNRCVTFEFKPYHSEELSTFIPKDLDASLALRYCHTPGQIKELKADDLNKLVELCDKIVAVIDKANYSNLFNLVESIKEFDVYLFYSVLLDTIQSKYIKVNDNKLLKLYNIVEDSLHKLMDSRYDVECLLISLVTELWEASRVK